MKIGLILSLVFAFGFSAKAESLRFKPIILLDQCSPDLRTCYQELVSPGITTLELKGEKGSWSLSEERGAIHFYFEVDVNQAPGDLQYRWQISTLVKVDGKTAQAHFNTYSNGSDDLHTGSTSTDHLPYNSASYGSYIMIDNAKYTSPKVRLPSDFQSLARSSSKF